MTSAVSLGADDWRGMIDRQQRSGLSISQFCQRVVVSDFTFRRSKQRLAKLVIVRVPTNAIPLTEIPRGAKDAAC